MPRLRCLPALKWIKCQIAIFGTAAIHANLLRLGTVPWQVSHIRQRVRNISVMAPDGSDGVLEVRWKEPGSQQPQETAT